VIEADAGKQVGGQAGSIAALEVGGWDHCGRGGDLGKMF
jgi:hypothetical protein